MSQPEKGSPSRSRKLQHAGHYATKADIGLLTSTWHSDHFQGILRTNWEGTTNHASRTRRRTRCITSVCLTEISVEEETLLGHLGCQFRFPLRFFVRLAL